MAFPQEFAHFIDCVANDRQPLVTGEDGRAVVELFTAVYRSNRERRPVRLPLDADG